jgi:hypothetical protein
MISPTMVEDDADYESKASAEPVIFQGGVGICASGLTREAANAVARLAPAHGTRVGPYGSVVVTSCSLCLLL